MQVMGGIPINVQPPGGSGGGSTIPTIAADVTYNIPTDYPSINAAIAYVLSAVRLNGAIVTINVESALIPTISDQIILNGMDLAYVKITNDGPVNIDASGFVSSPLGVPVWVELNNSNLGNISGQWAVSAGTALGIYAHNYSDINMGDGITVTSLNGFFKADVYILSNSNATLDLVSCNAIGAEENGKIFGKAVTITATDNNIPNIATYRGAEVTLLYAILNSGFNNSFADSDTGSRIVLESPSFNITGNDPLCAVATGASEICINGLVGVTGFSTGARFTVYAGSIIRAHPSIGSFGVDSQAPLTTTARGIIITP